MHLEPGTTQFILHTLKNTVILLDKNKPNVQKTLDTENFSNFFRHIFYKKNYLQKHIKKFLFLR